MGSASPRLRLQKVQGQGYNENMGRLPSGYVKIAIENVHLEWIFLLKIVIFHRKILNYQRVFGGFP